ncbi:putative microtubule-severing ATPase [Helianthus anomalus]
MLEMDVLEDTPGVRFDDVAGLSEAKRLLEEAVVLPLLMPEYFQFGKFGTSTWYHLLIPDHGCRTNNNGIVQHFLADFLQLLMISFFFSFRLRDELSGNRYRKYRLQYRYMKVKFGSEPVLGTPKVGTELVLRILWFGKFGTGTHYYLLISDYGFHTNIINI